MKNELSFEGDLQVKHNTNSGFKKLILTLA
jgi:hypothetical protein